MFRIHGTDHEMDLPVHVHSAPGALTAETQFAVPYVKWGMKNPSTLFLRVSDTVQIDIKACGSWSGAGPRSSAGPVKSPTL